MEVHPSQRRAMLAKKIWNSLRVTLALMRKGMISKKKLMMDINLMMKKGKLLRKSILNLVLRQNRSRRVRGGFGPFGIKEYEFSCSNSPTPAFFHIMNRQKPRFFPCIKPVEPLLDDDFIRQEQQSVVLLPKTPEIEYLSTFQFDNVSDFGNGENPTSAMQSPFSIRVSNYSSDDDDENCEEANREVDDQAEEFIRRFYDQLRVQSCRLLLQYQEMQYQEMLARGT